MEPLLSTEWGWLASVGDKTKPWNIIAKKEKKRQKKHILPGQIFRYQFFLVHTRSLLVCAKAAPPLSFSTLFFFLKFCSFYFMCIGVGVLTVFVSMDRMHSVHSGPRRGIRYSETGVTVESFCVGSGTQPGSSGRAANALDSRAASPAPFPHPCLSLRVRS